jgi:hypothetical protein
MYYSENYEWKDFPKGRNGHDPPGLKFGSDKPDVYIDPAKSGRNTLSKNSFLRWLMGVCVFPRSFVVQVKGSEIIEDCKGFLNFFSCWFVGYRPVIMLLSKVRATVPSSVFGFLGAFVPAQIKGRLKA